MENLLLIQTESLFAILVWGNVISLLFLAVYLYKTRNTKTERLILLFLALSRLSNAVYFAVASGRGQIADLISVNFGNTISYLGAFFEALAILRIIKKNTKRANLALLFILLLGTMVFNGVEAFIPAGGLRITISSLVVVALMLLPNVRMLISRDSNAYIKISAAFCSIYLFLMLGRAIFGLRNLSAGILTSNALQSFTFLALLLQLIVSLPSYILIMKDYADEALLLMATTDRLTGATNRHAFLTAATAVYGSSQRVALPIAVLFIDIDYFKQVNDRFGHAFGDVVLAQLSQLIDKCLRASDLSCRYGGEEFVVLLPSSGSHAATLVASRIMEEVRNARFEEHEDFHFTVSIGVAYGIPLPGQDFDAVIAAADTAMYKAKNAGRNQVVLQALASCAALPPAE